MKSTPKELDDIDFHCALQIMKWKEFKHGATHTYEPVGIPVAGFHPTRSVKDAFMLVDSNPGILFSLFRNSDKIFTAIVSSRGATHKSTDESAAYAITIAILHHIVDVTDKNRGPLVPNKGR